MTRRLTILRTWVIKEGQGNKGPWTLRGVEANNAQGNPIPDQLKTFSNLPLGEVDVEVEAQHHEEYGTSYLLKAVRSGGGGGAGEAIAELRRRIQQLESEVKRLAGLLDRRESESAPAGEPAATGLPDPDDDIPF